MERLETERSRKARCRRWKVQSWLLAHKLAVRVAEMNENKKSTRHDQLRSFTARRPCLMLFVAPKIRIAYIAISAKVHKGLGLCGGVASGVRNGDVYVVEKTLTQHLCEGRLRVKCLGIHALTRVPMP